MKRRKVYVGLRKPVTEITTENCRYLQILDVINDMDKYPVDAVKPEELVRGVAWDFGLDVNKLLVYCRQFYSDRLLGKIVDIMLGGVQL